MCQHPVFNTGCLLRDVSFMCYNFNMGYRTVSFAPGNIYHICHRGVARQNIFTNKYERQRFLALLVYYLPHGYVVSYSLAKKQRGLKKWEIVSRGTPYNKGLVDLLCYCLMGSHVHLLLCENTERGISTYLQRVFNSYARYFNVRHERSGPLFTGRFRAVHIDGSDQFLHVTRYVHLNPYVAGMVDDPVIYQWSSLNEYVGVRKHNLCHTRLLGSLMKPGEYRGFVTDYANYARELESIKHLILE